MIIAYLTCADKDEASIISRALLEKKLIACSRMTPITSAFLWNGKIENDDEVLLMMETIENKFDEIEKQVAKLHSYDQFVLTAVPVSRASAGVEGWLRDTIT